MSNQVQVVTNVSVLTVTRLGNFSLEKRWGRGGLLNAKGKKVFLFYLFIISSAETFAKRIDKGVDGLLFPSPSRPAEFSLLLFLIGSWVVVVLLPPPAQPTPPLERIGVVGGGALRSFARPHWFQPISLFFLISRPLSLQSRCFFSLCVWVRFFFFFFVKERTPAGQTNSTYTPL